jgi:hypothetical protein
MTEALIWVTPCLVVGATTDDADLTHVATVPDAMALIEQGRIALVDIQLAYGVLRQTVGHTEALEAIVFASTGALLSTL